MFDSRASLPNEVKADIEQFLNNARGTTSAWAQAWVLPTFVRRNIKLAEAPSYGKTIFEYEQNCHGAEDYKKVAEFVHAQFQTPAQAERQQPSAYDEIQDESIPAPEPVSQPDLRSDSQVPQETPAEFTGDDHSQSKIPFEIKSIPQTEPHTLTEFIPSNIDPNQIETKQGD
jgi:chromosome partitioning protein